MKTPNNPSKSAIARVKNPLPIPHVCNHCGHNDIECVENKIVYGKNYGEWPYIYLCNSCHSYVGLHPFTNIPLGTLASSETRKARKECKVPFESLYKTGKLSRDDAYKKLAAKLGIPVDECHFGWFNVDQCLLAAKAAREIYLGI